MFRLPAWHRPFPLLCGYRQRLRPPTKPLDDPAYYSTRLLSVSRCAEIRFPPGEPAGVVCLRSVYWRCRDRDAGTIYILSLRGSVRPHLRYIPERCMLPCIGNSTLSNNSIAVVAAVPFRFSFQWKALALVSGLEAVCRSPTYRVQRPPPRRYPSPSAL